MLYLKNEYKRLLEIASMEDVKSSSNNLIKTVSEISKQDINDDIKQSVSERCKWFLGKLFNDTDEIFDIENHCKEIELSKNKDKLILKRNKKEIEGVNKALLTVSVISHNMACKIFPKSNSDKLIHAFSKHLKDTTSEHINGSIYPIDNTILDYKCSCDSDYSIIITNLIVSILISENFDKYEMILLLLLTRCLKNKVTALKYLTIVLRKSEKVIGLSTEEVCDDIVETA